MGQRQVGDVAPGAGAVEGLVEAAVGADQHVVGVVGVEDDRVVVDVLEARVDPLEGAPAVVGDVHEHVHRVHPVHPVRVGVELAVVLRVDDDVVGHADPGLAPVGGPVEAASVLGGGGVGVEDVGVDGGDGQGDAAQVAGGEARGDVAPVFAAVRALPDAGFGAARDEDADVAAALEGDRVEHVGVAGVQVHVGDAGVLADLEDGGPGAAAVGGLEEAAVAPGRPKAPHGRGVHHVRVPGVDQDPADVLGGAEPGVGPAAPAVQALVDAVAPADAPLARVLARPEPDDVRVGGVDGDRAGRVGRVVVEDGSPGGAAVDGLPDVRRSGGHVPDAPVGGIDDDVGDSAGHEGRADAAEPEGGEEAGGEGGRGGSGAGLGVEGGGRGGRDRGKGGDGHEHGHSAGAGDGGWAGSGRGVCRQRRFAKAGG